MHKIKKYLALGGDPLAGPESVSEWADVTDRIGHISITRGRQSERAVVETGQMTWEAIEDSAGDFDPENTLGAFYPHADVTACVKVVGEVTDLFLPDCSISIADPAVVLAPGSNLLTGDQVVFSTTGNMPPALVAGTTYYVIAIDGDHFSLALSAEDAAAGEAISTLLLTNPTFDTGTLDGWTYTAGVSVVWAERIGGDPYAARASSGTGIPTVYLRQTVPAVPGLTYTASASLYCGTYQWRGPEGYCKTRLRFLDADGADIGSTLLILMTSPGDTAPLISAVAPPNTAWVSFDPVYMDATCYGEIFVLATALEVDTGTIDGTVESHAVPICVMYADDTPPTASTTNPLTAWQFTDGDILLQGARFAYGYTAGIQNTGAALADCLGADGLGWTGDTDIDAGLATVQPVSAGELSDIPDRISTVQEIENGIFFWARDGKPTFRGEDSRLISLQHSKATFSDEPDTDAGEIGYTSPVVARRRANIENDWHLTPTNQAEQSSSDPTSIAKYGPRTVAKTLPIGSEAEARQYCTRRIRERAYPRTRFEELSCVIATDKEFLTCLSLELGDLVTVKWKGNSYPMIFEGLNIDEQAGQLVITINTSSADSSIYWVWDSATWGETTVWY